MKNNILDSNRRIENDSSDDITEGMELQPERNALTQFSELVFEVPAEDEVFEGKTVVKIVDVTRVEARFPGKPARVIFSLRLKSGGIFEQGYNLDLSKNSLFNKVLRTLSGGSQGSFNVMTLIGTRWRVMIKRSNGFLNAWFIERFKKKVKV